MSSGRNSWTARFITTNEPNAPCRPRMGTAAALRAATSLPAGGGNLCGQRLDHRDRDVAGERSAASERGIVEQLRVALRLDRSDSLAWDHTRCRLCSRQRGFSAAGPATGPFATSYAAYRHAMDATIIPFLRAADLE